jgi:hypothetical protein
MYAGFFGADPPLANFFANPGVIFSDLIEAPIAQPVGSAVSDVGHPSLVGRSDQDRDAGRSHPVQCRIRSADAVDLVVCGTNGAHEERLGGTEVALEDPSNGFESQPAGRFAALVSTHAVRNDEQSVAIRIFEFTADILIGGPDTTHVASGCDLDLSRADRIHRDRLKR